MYPPEKIMVVKGAVIANEVRRKFEKNLKNENYDSVNVLYRQKEYLK